MRIKPGIYLITDPRYKRHGSLRACFADMLQIGVSALQYRDQSEDHRRRRQEAGALRDLCGRAGIPFIVNNDLELAKTLAADGIHLGQHDATVASARRALGGEALIGVSCHHSLDLARQAEKEGADYLSFGALFRSPTKPQASRVTAKQVAAHRRRLNVPVAVIGGISLSNLHEALRSQADMIAIISDLAEAANPGRQLARALSLMRARRGGGRAG